MENQSQAKNKHAIKFSETEQYMQKVTLLENVVTKNIELKYIPISYYCIRSHKNILF